MSFVQQDGTKESISKIFMNEYVIIIKAATWSYRQKDLKEKADWLTELIN